MDFPCTNNSAEYEALVLALRKAASVGAQRIIVNNDSLVMVGQVEKEFEAREPQLLQYLHLVRAMEHRFQGFTRVHIPKVENMEADSLAKAAAQREGLPPEVFYEILTEPAAGEPKDEDERERS